VQNSTPTDKRYLCWLFGFSSEQGNFVICEPGRTVDWDTGIKWGYGRGRAGVDKFQSARVSVAEGGIFKEEEEEDEEEKQRPKKKSKKPDWKLAELKGKRAKEFTKGVKEALSELTKDVNERMDWNH